MLKIMYASANPTNTDRLRLDEESRALEERLDSSDLRGKYELKKLFATRIRDFRQKMLEFKPEIVHFVGHGTPDGLIFENDTGQTQVIGVEAIVNLFEFFKAEVKCVILNACDTKITAEAINLHIPYVVGMCEPISDEAAIEFTTGFYDAVGAGETFDRAFQLGRNAIESEGYENEVETPVLYFNEQTLTQNQQAQAQKAKAAGEPLEIFLSYSHRDEEMKDELIINLAPLKVQGLIKTWHDRDIELADEWKKQIDTRLNTSDIILLLVSPSFVASEYCYDIEMKRAMERHEAGEARVIPIILRPTIFEDLPFARFQAAPRNARPVTSWLNRDDAYYDIAVQIRQVVKKMRGEN
jgi:hypothetical protein